MAVDVRAQSVKMADTRAVTSTVTTIADTRAVGDSLPLASLAADRPKLVIMIVVDQLSADLFAEYRPHFTGGFARLSGGVVFPSGYHAHAATETCPGHATIATGYHPAHSGIIANHYFDLSIARSNKRVYCAEDETHGKTHGAKGASHSASGRYTPSARHLKVPTLGDRMKEKNPATQVVAVAGKDRSAIMMAGHNADEVMWLSASGLASLPGARLSSIAEDSSKAITAAIKSQKADLPLPDVCRSRDHRVAIGDGASVGDGRLGRSGSDFRRFMASPEADAAVLATAEALRAERNMGQGDATDLLILGLAATDYVGHVYGTAGAEMCLQLLNLDRELDSFFAQLDASGVDYAVVLTADHGGHDLPERLRENAISAERVDPTLTAKILGKAVATKLGLATEPLLFGNAPAGDYYLSKSLTAAQRNAALTELVAVLRAHHQVEAVHTSDELTAHPISRRSPELWSIRDRMRASFDSQRSGDLVVALKPRVTPIPDTKRGYVATHGSLWDYDRRVPILFWHSNLTGFEQPNPVMVVDIVPTLAAWIGLLVEHGTVDGRCLDIMAGPPSLCTR